MRASISTTGIIYVTLSKRNVLALLHKLEMPGSARTLIGQRGPWPLILRVESDEDHYADDPEPAGTMHPMTESFIAQQEDQ